MSNEAYKSSDKKEKKLRGLTNEEANRRLEEYGYNRIEEKNRISALTIFFQQFQDFITWVLIAATVLSGLMGEVADAVTIIIIIILNATLGFIQEYRTEKSLETLKALAAPTAKVIRGNRLIVVNAEELVPGDLVVLESGDRIPADCKIKTEDMLIIDESLLTGESIGVEKNCNTKNNDIYMGTVILKGKAKAEVVHTGMETSMGKIAHMMDEIEEEKSPLKINLDYIGKILVIMCLVICAMVTILGIYRGQDVYEMFLVGVSLAVAAIPEGLAAIVTIALALGVSRMLKRNALVRKLPAVETLGCTSVICSDKTGTLTQNNMTVTKLYSDGKVHDTGKGGFTNFITLKKIFTYCSDCSIDAYGNNVSSTIHGTPTEKALVNAFCKDGREYWEEVKGINKVFEVPFDSSRKMMSVVVSEKGKNIAYIKGAPEKIIDKCTHIKVNGVKYPLNSEKKKELMNAMDSLTKEALRLVAGAIKEENVRPNGSCESELTFIGMAGMIDPPRREVKGAVRKCHESGIKVVMITGDHKNTAFAIAKQIGICSNEEQVLTGPELEEIDDKQLHKIVHKIKVYARVTPEHKLRIVKAFKRKGDIVAMTGDGVNDAPAIKEADIGIAMGISGSDVTKEASSMILLDDNFSTIVASVEEGRTIYDNIRKFIRYLLSCNIGEVTTMFIAALFYLPTPLLPIQILFVNLATDGLPAMALGVDPTEKDIMSRRPRKKSESIFARGLKEKIITRGVLIGVCTLLAFMAGMYYQLDLQTCRTIALSTLVMSQLLHVFECRSERKYIFQIGLFTNKTLILAALSSVAMLLGIIYVPFFQGVFKTVALETGHWIIIMFFSSIITIFSSMSMAVMGNKKVS